MNHRYLLWFLLAIPSYPVIFELIYDDQHYPGLMHTTGTFSAHLLVITLVMTPLRLLFRGMPAPSRFITWFIRRRRYFGVASFVYAAIHTVLYLHDTWDFYETLVHLTKPEITIGWIAFFVLLALAITSNDKSVAKMGKSWKSLQRFSHLAAVCVFLHWIIYDFLLAEVLIWFGCLLVLQLLRISQSR